MTKPVTVKILPLTWLNPVPTVILFVGVNGVGKTTTIWKNGQDVQRSG